MRKAGGRLVGGVRPPSLERTSVTMPKPCQYDRLATRSTGTGTGTGGTGGGNRWWYRWYEEEER